MLRPKLEVADIFRLHGEAWRAANARRLSLAQRRVMTAIETCRTAALGGHVERCEDCAHTRVAYNSCRNRHCPRCQWRSAQTWLAAREAELLPVPYFHLVFILPTALGPIALQNKAVVYGLLLKAAAETLVTAARDQKHVGAKIGITAVLHTWGQDLQHHPHVHCIVPGGGISPDGRAWVSWKPDFLRRGRQLSDLFRRLFLIGLSVAFDANKLHFFAELVSLKDRKAFCAALAPLRTTHWGVYAKEALGSPKQVLRYLAQYTHRVAITNNRLVDLDETHVTFRSKGERESGAQKSRDVRLKIAEFIRRFLLHVVPNGFQRIRHYGFLANNHRADELALCRRLLDAPPDSAERIRYNEDDQGPPYEEQPACPCCGGRMKIIETFEGTLPRRYHVRKLDAL